MTCSQSNIFVVAYKMSILVQHQVLVWLEGLLAHSGYLFVTLTTSPYYRIPLHQQVEVWLRVYIAKFVNEKNTELSLLHWQGRLPINSVRKAIFFTIRNIFFQRYRKSGLWTPNLTTLPPYKGYSSPTTWASN